jgi:hypothetical protein
MTIEGGTGKGVGGADDDFGTVKDPVPPKERKVDRIALQQEGMRGLIALILLLLVGFTLVWALLSVDGWAEMRELLEIWLPALTGLLGSAVGFYFGTRA